MGGIVKKFSVLGVAVLAVLAMAIGAGSANAATVLCSAEEEPCAAANILPAGSGYGFAGNATMTGSGFEVECYGAVFGNYTKTKGTEFFLYSQTKMYRPNGPCRGKIGSAAVTCEAKTNESSSVMFAYWNDAILIGEGYGNVPFEITLPCSPEPFVTIECAYKTKYQSPIEAEIVTNSGENGEVNVPPTTLIRTKGGASCPSTVTFTLPGGRPNLGNRFITTG
jgi:hypothetical protein